MILKLKCKKQELIKNYLKKELANKLSLSINIIQNFENGKAIYNNNIINKIKKRTKYIIYGVYL